jgi:hypothetical protein
LWTDADGRFATNCLRPGNVRYEAFARDRGCARGVFAVAERGRTSLRLQLQQPTEVFGRVADAAGPPPAAVVRSGRPGDLLSREVTCAADGSYRLTDLAPGPIQLLARELEPRPGAAPRRVSETVELQPGQRWEWSPDLGSQRLPGRVVDEHDRPLAGWIILARQAGSNVHRSTTDADGRFALPVQGDGPFDVSTYAPDSGADSFAAAVARGVAPAPGPVLLTVDRTLRPVEVTGRVVSPAGSPLTATVSCTHRGLGQTVSIPTGADGRFRFAAVPPGAIALRAAQPGLLAAVLERELPPGLAIDVGALLLDTGSAVHGAIRSTTGQAPAQLQICLLTDFEVFTADCTGSSYRFPAVPPGRHRLLLQGEGIAAQAFPLDVPPGVELVQDVLVTPGHERRIRVTSPGGNARWITLALWRDDEPYSWLAGRERGDGAAEFTVWMAPGVYQAKAWDDVGRESRTTLRFGAGGAAAATALLTLR